MNVKNAILEQAIFGSSSITPQDLTFKGTYNASGGTYPASPDLGDYWVINIAGTLPLGGVTENDFIWYNGSAWGKTGALTTGVSLVNTYSGNVTLDADDISDTTTTNKFVTSADITKLGNLSNTNSGDETKSSIETKLSGSTVVTLEGSTFNGNSQLVKTTTEGKLPAIDGSLLTGLPSGFADPMTTRGDIIIRNASNVTSRLGKGTAGQVLKSDGTDIEWGDVTDTSETLSVDTSLDNTHNKVYCNNAGAITVTLPNATTYPDIIYTISNINTGTTTIATTSSQTINGATTRTLSGQYATITLQAVGTQWIILTTNAYGG